MSKSSRSATGFSTVEITIAAVVIAVLVVVGGLVYRRNHGSETNKTSSTSHTGTQQTATTTPPSSTQTAQQYLVIKEWGVQIPLSDSIKDAYYVPSTGSRGFDGIVNEMYIGVKSLDASGCAADGNGGNHDGKLSAPAMIFRAKPTEVDPVTNKTYQQEYPDGVTLDGYFYAYQQVADPNRTDCKASPATLQQVDSAIASAAKNITATTR
jgi:hypothetical protein